MQFRREDPRRSDAVLPHLVVVSLRNEVVVGLLHEVRGLNLVKTMI
jgi:hypothetical protein